MYILYLSLMGIGASMVYLWYYIRKLEITNAFLLEIIQRAKIDIPED
jgi:hypothetical protein